MRREIAVRLSRWSVLVCIPLLAVAEETETGERPISADAQVVNFGNNAMWSPLHSLVRSIEASFIDEASFDVHLRGYYFEYNQASGNVSKATAIGGEVVGETGKIANYFSVGAGVATSQRLTGELDEDGTGLLKPGQEGYTVLHLAYVDGTFGDSKVNQLGVRAFRQEINTPFINKNDSRMTPNTFEAYRAVGRWVANQEAEQSLDYLIGYVDKMKARNSDQFIPMDEIVGANTQGTDGVFMAGGRWNHGKQLAVGAIGEVLPDALTHVYSGLSFQSQLMSDWKWRTEAQATFQAVGSRIDANEPTTWHVGLRGVGSWNNFTTRLAATSTASGDDILSPFGGKPHYLSLMLNDFDRAGEQAVGMALSYVFDVGSIKGIGMLVNTAIGDGGNAGSTRSEIDATLEWAVPEENVLHGVWLRLRYASTQESGVPGRGEQWRAIIDYRVHL